MNEPQISLSGHLASDPVVRMTPTGVPVLDLRVATTRRVQVGEDWQDGETLWFDVSCWRQTAENAGTSLHKGDKVTVQGKLLQRSWSREDGSTGTTLVVDATSVGIDLSRFPALVRRPIREGSASDLLRNGGVNQQTGEILGGGPLVPEQEAPAEEHAA